MLLSQNCPSSNDVTLNIPLSPPRKSTDTRGIGYGEWPTCCVPCARIKARYCRCCMTGRLLQSRARNSSNTGRRRRFLARHKLARANVLMATSRELKELLRPLLARRADLAFVRRTLFFQPFTHYLRGVEFTTSRFLNAS